MLRNRFSVWVFFILFSIHVDAAEPSTRVVTPQASVELVSEYEAAAPGATQWIGVLFKPLKGWHVYWKNPGDSGLPPRVEWTSNPEGSTIGFLEFPTPSRIPYGPLVNYGYEGDVLFPASWTSPSHWPIGGAVTITANLKWLICKQECVPGRAVLTLRLPVESRDRLRTTSGTHTSLFKSTLDSLSKVNDGKVRAILNDESSSLELSVHIPQGKTLRRKDLKSIYFFPESELGIAPQAPQTVKETVEGISITIPRRNSKQISEIRGILKIDENHSYQILEKIRPTENAVAPSDIKQEQPPEKKPLALMLLFAFIGGVILNLMPCILPVLSIKILGLTNQSGSNRTVIRKHGIIFTLGVLLSFWVLAGILLTVRASGQSLGWGFQLQDPVFVGVLAVLFFMMSLNLFGIFEVGETWMGAGGSFAAREGYIGSFFTGVLTTVAATPCSAPFMGSALGFALTQPSMIAVLVLTVLALGLSFPYLLFSFLPAAVRVLPRPGIWMRTLKEFLAFPLLATVVWLVSVVGGQAGFHGIERLLIALLCASFFAWLLGKSTLRPVLVNIKRIALLLSFLFAFIALRSIEKASTEKNGLNSLASSSLSSLVQEPWNTWSLDAQQKALAEGKIVLVNFTADWCVTCKVNEKLVFERESVLKVLRSAEVSALLADWSNGDPVITAELAKVDRNSVPVYLVYRPGENRPRILSQILSVDELLTALKK